MQCINFKVHLILSYLEKSKKHVTDGAVVQLTHTNKNILKSYRSCIVSVSCLKNQRNWLFNYICMNQSLNFLTIFTSQQFPNLNKLHLVTFSFENQNCLAALNLFCFCLENCEQMQPTFTWMWLLLEYFSHEIIFFFFLAFWYFPYFHYFFAAFLLMSLNTFKPKLLKHSFVQNCY